MTECEQIVFLRGGRLQRFEVRQLPPPHLLQCSPRLPGWARHPRQPPPLEEGVKRLGQQWLPALSTLRVMGHVTGVFYEKSLAGHSRFLYQTFERQEI